VTHAPASYHPQIHRPLIMLIVLAAVPLGACGSQKSTLPPSPGRSGSVALHDLARYPEVYADAQVSTVGTVASTGSPHGRRYVLDGGGGGARIVLEPNAGAAADLGRRVAANLGRRVRVSGLFTVTFQFGYEILISRISPAGSL
jgi:hypothetical protein